MSTVKILSGVTSSGLYVRDGETLWVQSGGVATNTVILGGGLLSPFPGGIAENIDVRSRGFIWGKGELGGTNTVEGGTVANVTLVGELSVTAGATIDVVVASGGVEVIGGNAVMTGGLVSSGGLLDLGGSDFGGGGIVVSSGGLFDLGGSDFGGGEVHSGATLEFSGNAVGLAVESGGTVEFQGLLNKKLVYSAAVLGATTVLDGVTMSSGVTLVLDPRVVSGGVLSLTADGPVLASVTVSGGKLIGPGAVDSALVFFGGSVSGVDIVGNLTIGGSGHGDTVGIGAVEDVGGIGAVVSGETVLRFGEMNVTGGEALGTVVKGGRLVIDGEVLIVSGTVLSSRSRELVTNIGTDIGTRILAGAVEVISGGAQRASSISSLISSGGLEVVSDVQAVTDAPTVFAGGTLSVTPGGKILDGLTLAGGTAIISGTVASGQTVSFGASGVLELGNLPAFQAAISGLSTSAQKVDLDGFAFSTSESVGWAQSGTSGTLTVSDGAKVATLTLLGSYTASDFKLAGDGHGGTFVFDPSPGPAVTRLTQAAAGLHGGRFAAEIAVVHGGGTVTNIHPVVAAISGC